MKGTVQLPSQTEKESDFEELDFCQDCDEAIGSQRTMLPKNSSDMFKKTTRAGPGYQTTYKGGPGNKFSHSTTTANSRLYQAKLS